MATTIDIVWYPDPAHFGDTVRIIVSLDPTPPHGAKVWIFIDGSPWGAQLTTDPYGQVEYYLPGLGLGPHTVEAGFATFPPPASPGDPVESDSAISPARLIVLPALPASPPPPITQGSTPEQTQVDIQGFGASDGGARMQTGPNAFNGIPNVDPFTGAPAADPYTGELLSARDAAINDRIKGVYSQPDAVPESTRYAIFDFYAKSSIDLTGVPQSVQNSIFEVFNQVPEPPESPLPGLGLDEFVSATFSSALGDLSSGIRSVVGATSIANEVIINADALALELTGRNLRPIFGAAQAAGGAMEIASGVGIAVGSEGVAAVAGGALAAHGLDQLIAGVRTIFGEEAQTLTQYILTDALTPTLGSNAALAAGLADGILSLGFGSVGELPEIASRVGGAGLPGLTAEAAAVRIELSGAMQLGELESTAAEASAATKSQVPLSQLYADSTKWSATRIEQEVAPSALNSVTPTGPSFEGLIDIAEFENDRVIIDRLTRARQFDIGGYRSLTGAGEFGRVGDALDSDEVLQNAYIRMMKGVSRGSKISQDNPAIALRPELHRQIRNLRTPDMQGLTPDQVLQYHLKQMDFVPGYILRVLEDESRQFISRTFL